eukprot:10319464-Heterocapsa_arctica.AAC.1
MELSPAAMASLMSSLSAIFSRLLRSSALPSSVEHSVLVLLAKCAQGVHIISSFPGPDLGPCRTTHHCFQ